MTGGMGGREDTSGLYDTNSQTLRYGEDRNDASHSDNNYYSYHSYPRPPPPYPSPEILSLLGAETGFPAHPLSSSSLYASTGAGCGFLYNTNNGAGGYAVGPQGGGSHGAGGGLGVVVGGGAGGSVLDQKTLRAPEMYFSTGGLEGRTASRRRSGAGGGGGGRGGKQQGGGSGGSSLSQSGRQNDHTGSGVECTYTGKGSANAKNAKGKIAGGGGGEGKERTSNDKGLPRRLREASSLNLRKGSSAASPSRSIVSESVSRSVTAAWCVRCLLSLFV